MGWELCGDFLDLLLQFTQVPVKLAGGDPLDYPIILFRKETEKDEYGLQIPVLEYAHHPNTKVMLRHAAQQARALFSSLGATDVRDNSDQLGGGCHNMGVARMCVDPQDGVTNRWGQTHDIENLFVSDGSLFSTSAAPNPTLTIVALAIRQAEHIAGRMVRREM